MKYSDLGHIFLSFLFFNLIVLVLYNHYKRGHYFIKKRDLILYIILFIAFGTYGGGEGDYFRYKIMVEEYHSIQDVLFYTGIEKQYVFLAYCVGGNYLLWRLILFSIQFIGFGFLLYKSRLNTYPVLLSFTSFCLVMSVYGRSVWGIMFFFLGVYLLIEKKNPLYLIAIALCYVSHSSEIVLIALLPLAFFNIKKWHIFAYLIVFSTLVALFKNLFTDLLSSGGLDVEEADYLNGRLQTYGNSDAKNYFGSSIGEKIQIFLEYAIVFSFIIPIIHSIFKSKNGYMSFYKPVRRIINIIIGIVFLAFIVFAASVGGAPIFYRIFDMVLFPVAIILPCMCNIKFIKKRTFNIYLFLFILYSEVGYFRDVYYAYANGNF